jgi:hypothetical protein
MRKILSFLTAILFAGSMMAANYELVTAASQLEAGAKYVIGTAAGKFIATTSNANNRKITDATVTDGVVEATDAVMVFTLGGSADAWTFATENYAGAAGYLNATNTTGSNNLKVVADLDDYAYFTIAIADGVTTITCNGKTSRNILYQNGSTCFSCYNEQTSAQYIKPSLYKEVSSTPQTSYTVAGSSETAFGTVWKPEDKANDMKLQADGSYKWEKTGLELAAGTIEFKVCENHAWDVAYPSDNYQLSIAESGVYTITITYEPANENKVSAVATKTGNVVIIPTIAMHGNFTGDWADTENFELAEGKATASLALNLAEGNYEFGMRIGGSGNWTSNGAAFTRESASHEIVSGSGNLTIAADAAGEYLFTWTFETNTLAITYPKKQAVLPAGAYMLTFKGTGDNSDKSNEFKKDDDIFTDECKAYVASVDSISKVYAARIIDENTSSLKFGTTSVKGYLQFTLATPVEVDSIIVNATQYGKNAAEVTVNGTKFDLTAGNKVPTDCKITPEGKVSAITIAQTGSERIYLRYVTIYPKQGGEEPVVDPAKFYITGDSALVVNAGLEKAKAWAPDAIKSTETSYKLNLAAGDYKLKVTVDGTWATAKGFDALTTIATGLTGDGDGNICFTLTEAGEVNVHYDGEFFFLNGNFYVAPVEVKYYLKNNWGGEAWTWKEMTALGDGTYMLYNVVVGGEGVNRNTAESEEGASWFAWADIETFDASYVSATIGALDTVVIYFDPEAVNSFTGANGMSAQILGKYVAPVDPQPAEHTYTVAGNLTAAFGAAWDPAYAANDMVKQEDGTYKWEKAELVLPAGTIEFKVCEDHAWTVNYPAQNYQLAIAEAGEYTLTITFDPATQTVAANAEKTGSAEVDPTVSAKGSWDEWAKELVFTLAADKATASLTVNNVKAGTYEFKVILNGGEWRSNGYKFTREAASVEGITGNDNANMKLVADVDGTYTFTWTFATNALNITFPAAGPTALDNINADGKAVKVLRNGQILIKKGDKTYNVMGAIVR